MEQINISVDRYEPFLFMPGMTIEAAIRFKNKYIHGQILTELMKEFNMVNDFRAPHAGESFLIPVLKEGTYE